MKPITMPWIILTIADLNDVRAGKMIEAARTKALADGQADPLPGAIAKVVAELRAAVAFGNAALDQDTAKIPESFRDMAAQKVFRLLKARLMMALTEDEKEEERTWQKRLEQLCAGRWPVDATSAPTTAPAVQGGAAVELASSTPRKATRTSLSGL